MTQEKKIIIVYDKDSEKAANVLYNYAAEKKISATKWTEEEYKSNEKKITNSNKFVLLSRSLIDICLVNPKIPWIDMPNEDEDDERLLVLENRYKIEGNTLGLLTKVQLRSEEIMRHKWLVYISSVYIILKKILEKKFNINFQIKQVSWFAENKLDDFFKKNNNQTFERQ